MTTKDLRRHFRLLVTTINKNPAAYLAERRKSGNIFESSWVEKGEAERRAKRKERRAA